ncbi:glutamate receptor, ionotropic kainate 2 [Paragonimus westermani]|uniref:Glutamate receptor 1 n=1 Tax=Paragonimus westermani TaxID=34504 RepID=A0A5J4NAH1_9TREM|nr:glutamate receptor, ionotropic kainate 2 [Paragonimus westermani]
MVKEICFLSQYFFQEKPYMMYKGNTAPGEPRSTDSKDWEGYCIDLLNEIGKELNFSYVINLVPDATYGNMRIVDGEEVWDGMVQELKTRRADLAVGSFTITYDRARVIDFTTPFMYLGISIIYKRIEDKRSHLFSFLQPLSAPVWGYILAATIMVSLILFVVARFSPYEWKINHPCNVNSNVVENKFNVLNSFWFTFGALMQKGSDVVPHATSTRIIAGFWWFFTLIVISSYTANLAAFLTVARMESPIENAEDLAKQTKIKYGTRQGGSTIAFFEHSKFPTYKRMWQFMSSQKGLLMNTTPEAIRRVKREEYAYILESTMNEYYTQRDCQLMQIGGLLDSKGYGIGLPQGSIYRDPISETILKLQNDQILDKLKFRWWRERDINVTCDSNKKKSDTSSLGVEKVGGCFVMLLIGMGVSLMVSVLEFINKSYHRVALSERSLSEELARDFRFSTACSSFRSQTAEDAMKLPPPQAIQCCARPPNGNSRLGNALSYAPCLPSPQFPLKPTDLQDTLSVKLTGPTPPNPGAPESDSSSNVLMLNIKNDAGVQNHSPPPEKHQEVFDQSLPADYRMVQSKQHPKELISNHEDNMTDDQFHRMNNGYGVHEHSRDSPELEDLESEEWLAGPSPNYSASPTTFSLRGHSSVLPTRNQMPQSMDGKLGSRGVVMNQAPDLQLKKVSC